MFLGHYGVALGAKAVAPRVSLGWLVFASLFIDLLWPTLLLLGMEQVAIVPGITTVTPLDFTHYPISHSLLAVVLWGLLLAMLYRWRTHYAFGALVMGAVLVSHWTLDALVHRPDLPLVPGDAVRVGLGFWSSLPATLLLEMGIFFVGLFIYLRITRAVDRIGHIALAALVITLLLIYAGNLMGPPPPNVTALAWAGEAQWLCVIWALWIERHRTSKQEGN